MNVSKVRTAMLVAAALGAMASTGAQASDSLSVTVNATVVGVCKFFTASPVINITNTGTGSNIDPSLVGPASGNVNINYRCSNGTTPVFTVPASSTVTCTTAGTCGSTTMTTGNTFTGGGNGTGL